MENVEPIEEDYKAARELVFGIWSDTYRRLRPASSFEGGIMDEAHDLASYTASADTRTLSILVVSFLEDALKKTFSEDWGVKTSKDTERYFGANGPLSTFAQRVLVARGLGWLVDEEVSELDILRKIRNAFAHNHRIHDLSSGDLLGLATSLEKREQIWRRREKYAAGYDAAPLETQLRMRVFCAGIFIISGVLGRAKRVKAQLPPTFTPAPGWDEMFEVEQAMFDAAIRHCWLTLGFGYSGTVYQYRRDRDA